MVTQKLKPGLPPTPHTTFGLETEEALLYSSQDPYGAKANSFGLQYNASQKA